MAASCIAFSSPRASALGVVVARCAFALDLCLDSLLDVVASLAGGPRWSAHRLGG